MVDNNVSIPKAIDLRAVFLKEFVKELILNSRTESEEIEVYEEPELAPEFFEAEKIEEELKESLPRIREPEKKVIVQPKAVFKPRVIEGGMTWPMTMKTMPKAPIKKPVQKKPTDARTIEIAPEKSVIKQTIYHIPEEQLAGEKVPENFDLGKLNLLIKDPKVLEIECPGPGKFVMARVLGRINVTKTTLSQSEIQAIIDLFSKTAKVPIIEGLFKAAVGNLVMTAVISNVVGARFIISKITPYSFGKSSTMRI